MKDLVWGKAAGTLHHSCW